MRSSGILMPIFSLPSKYGIGTLGEEAYKFIDFLKKSGQTYWQILPIGTTGFGDSPYQSFSAYAGNPYFIDLDFLINDGLLNKKDVENIKWYEEPDKVNYEILYKSRYQVLRKAYEKFRISPPPDFEKFKSENDYWLKNYAMYSAIKDCHNGMPFYMWEDGYKFRNNEFIKKTETDLSEEIGFYEMLQYLFSAQWFKLKEYANRNGIKIIGDIPIYVAADSADVWGEPEQFMLDKDLQPYAVAGCPPDAFSDEGQLWGNPLYDWKYMENDGFKWWINRMAYSSRLYDIIRIDHFRAFSAFYSIPYGEKTAVNGKWIKGPSKRLFTALEKSLGKLNIIAEDLGTIDDEVRELLNFTKYPGMKVLQFAFTPDTESSYLPHNIIKNCVVYTGTHDNDTAIGFMKDAESSQVKFMREYLRIDDSDSFNWSLIKAAMATSADTVILQMQDFLGLDNSARINIPSTLGGNWQWRISENCCNDWLAKIIYDCTNIYFRLPKTCKSNK